jgi:hypothetical protein
MSHKIAQHVHLFRPSEERLYFWMFPRSVRALLWRRTIRYTEHALHSINCNTSRLTSRLSCVCLTISSAQDPFPRAFYSLRVALCGS